MENSKQDKILEDVIRNVDAIVVGRPDKTVPSESGQILNLGRKMLRSDVVAMSKEPKDVEIVKDTGLVEMARRRQELFEKNEEKEKKKELNPKNFYDPPYDPAIWVFIPEFTSKTYKAIDILKNNIIAPGVSIVPYKHKRELTKEETSAFEEEKKILEKFFSYPNNLGQSTREIFINFFVTREYCGVGAIRFSENILGEYQSMEHYPAYKLLVRKDGHGFASVSNSFFGSGVEYFKVFGDKRIMDKTTGEYGSDIPTREDFVPFENRADSIFWLPIYTPASPVTGMPRYAPSKHSIIGNLLCGKSNAEFFVRGLLTRLLIIVNNGRLDDESASAIQQFFDHSKGIENSASALLLQPAKKSIVASDLMGAEDNKVKIDVVKLFESHKEDATFKVYREQNDKEQQNIFAIPDLFYGVAGDITRASANVIKKLTQIQTFDPIAREIEDPINSQIIPNLLPLKKRIAATQMPKILEERREEIGLEKDFIYTKSGKEQLEYLKAIMWKDGYRFVSASNRNSLSDITTAMDRDGEPFRNVDLVFERMSIARFSFIRPDILDPLELSEIIRNSVSVGAWTPNSAIINVFRRLFPDIEPIDEEWANIPMNMLVMLINSKLGHFQDPNTRERLNIEWAKLGLSKQEGEELAEQTREEFQENEEQPEEVKSILREYGTSTISEFSDKHPEVLLDTLFSLRERLDDADTF